MKIFQVNPVGSMDLLSQLEVDRLTKSTNSPLYIMYRNCSLAVLNVGSDTDDSETIYKAYSDFDIKVIRRERGVKLELINPPEHAFVDGELIAGIRELLFTVLRDILYTDIKRNITISEADNANYITHFVFDILRNAGALQTAVDPSMIVCWGGHSIKEIEYKYTKEVGYQLGLRSLNLCTGCGPGAMKGPMKGATIGHLKQRINNGRYLGLTEPSIIAAEPPNPIVNELVILPDIEKRLEAFVRVAHGIVIFPGGVGTAEELLYILGILMNPANTHQALPVVLTGPKESKAYFESIDAFIGQTLGEEAQRRYTIVVDDAERVATIMKSQMNEVRQYRKSIGDAYHYNWSLKIEADFQYPFNPTHENVAKLDLHLAQDKAKLAANLRRAFSSIVAGNVKDEGVKQIKKQGPFKIHGDKALMDLMDTLLQDFMAQGRMKLPGTQYVPCYEVIKE
ncbi:nucleotide 5'-monophosphate nucleosidase PpnN [Algibacillus agarilyticus]|uniref:nucleotide 5'-monophosphate nucleosidase PpnN n=1 Tax=Algibacillus agarilyticus TaxID=2234133 RepID=UPI000DD04339|nr:nucleotide 5'-monophosphate nucleosidase PpnN [Algibacillus agarilyticus]